MSEKSDKLRAMLEKEKERRIKLNNRILPRNVLKESTTMLPYPMPRRNLCG